MRAAARYAAALLFVAAALVPTIALAGLLAPMRLFFLWSAVLITAILAGTGPALFATLLAIVAALAFVLEVHDATALVRLVLFAVFAGGISIAVGRARELSDRLLTSERRYRTLIESNPQAQSIWTATPEGKVTTASEWQAIIGDAADDPVHPDDGPRVRAHWQECLRTGEHYEEELRIRTASGRYRWFASKASPVRDMRGRIREWAGIISDIHDRKRLEDNAAFINRASELLSSTLASHDVMRRFAQLCVPALGDWCAIHLGSDEHYERLIAEHSDPARVAILDELDAHPRPQPEHDAIAQVLLTGRSQLVESMPEEILRASMNAEQFALVQRLGFFSWIITPMKARGRTVGTLTVVYGESRRRYSEADVPFVEELARRAANALDNARLFESAEEANRTKDEFLATLSHELRTPLTAILGWAEMLAMGAGDADTQRLAINTIRTSARVQGELIDDLLDLSGVVAGTLRLAIDDVDLGSIVQEAIAGARPAADAKGLHLELTNPDMHVIVRGDARRLRQVVWNLVNNGVKFTDRDGRVTITLTQTEHVASVTVTDTGRGIEPSFLPFVWDRFRQADSSTSRRYGGLGLGLAVVRHLVEMHGGTCHVESEGVGKGATFRVDLPIATP